MSSALLCVALALSLAGCGTSTVYKIPQGELARLSQIQPELRGMHVRVVEDPYQSEPPKGPEVRADTRIEIRPQLNLNVSLGGGGGGHHHGGGGGGGGGGLNLGGGGGGGDGAAVALIILAIGAIVVGGMAAIEGTRHDGWADVNPMQTVHLYGPDGAYSPMPLAYLTPEAAAWAQEAYLRKDEGPWAFSPAPLNRTGWTMSYVLGGATVPSWNGDDDLGGGGRIQVGYFPERHVGVLLDWGAYWRDNEVGETAYLGRYGLELEVLPLDLRPFSLGAYGQLGLAHRLEDGPGDRNASGTSLGGGVLLQIELATRLGLTLRAGWSRAFDRDSTELGVGLAVF